MIEAMRSVGVNVESSDGGRTLKVQPRANATSANVQAGAPVGDRLSDQAIQLFIANSGTSIRFLTAALSALGGHYRLHGVPRMHQRPIGDLTTAIESVIRGTIKTESAGGCPPVIIDSQGWSKGDITVAGSVSSQYLSGLLMAAPISGNAIRIRVQGELVSLPYVEMTCNVIQSFGASVQTTKDPESNGYQFDVQGNYRGLEYDIEPDASAASYFWAAAAITGGTVRVEGLSLNAMQGDVGFCKVLESMGCEVEYADDSVTVTGKPLRGVDVDMNAISDTVQTLAVVALFAKGPTRVRGVAHNRFKETDRIGDLATELRKLGATVEEHEDGLTITPAGEAVQGATIATYHDHRMAMSLSLAGLRIPGVRIEDPACTGKTYPEYFADLERLIGRPHRWG